MKSLFLYKYWLVHYFSIKNDRRILFKQKIAKKVDDSDFTESDLIDPPWGNVFVQTDRHYRTTDRQYDTFKIKIK